VPDVPALSGTTGLAAAVEAIFGDEGRLARALPAFESRAGQRRMAAAVADTLERGGVLLVEAGTGTGKTLAYLVPAILSGQRVLVSTGTKPLQEQIYFKDLDILRDALGIPFVATCMKGRANYVCRHRLDMARASWESVQGGDWRAPESVVLAPMLDRWLQETDTGDRAELVELPEDWAGWNEIAASAERCLGADCPRHGDCFLTRLRARAAASDVIIVNHHLLCADAAVRERAFGEVIPACRHLVLDEAHQLEDVVTQYFGVSVSAQRVEEIARDGERAAARGTTGLEPGECRAALAHLRDCGRSFFSSLAGLVSGVRGPAPAGAEDRVRVTPEALAESHEDGERLVGALDGLQSILQPGHDARPQAPGAPAGPEDLAGLARRAGEVRDQLRFLLRADDADHVYFVESKGRGIALRAAPITVSSIVRGLLIDRAAATVLTSATMAVGESFDYVRGRLGLAAPYPARTLRLASEFDYARQAILYLPRAMPDPRSPRFAEAAGREVIEILRRTEGRAFVLFTSYAVLRAIHERLAAELSYPILVQGTMPRSALLREFRSTAHAVLLATASFWQGVDVMGEALSCVIIDKLPFASPADPVTAARIAAVADAGGNPFHEYQVPVAILALLQGLGRLIRHRQDRGVLAVLDPRLRTKEYGRRFLASLPAAPVTHNLRDLAAFFIARADVAGSGSPRVCQPGDSV
jgi:ATP-dependent DNA helicase DinG